MSLDDHDHAGIHRRGQQIFQLALRMELGDAARGSGAEALFYLADAIARLAALSEDPRLALETVVRLFGKIDDDWFAKNHEPKSLTSINQLFADLAFETVLGRDDGAHVEVGPVAARALSRLTDAIVCVAALNDEPRKIIEHVVQRLDESDVERVRKEQRK